MGAGVAAGTALLALTQFVFVHLEAHGLTRRRAQEAWLKPYGVGDERSVAEALTEGACPPRYAWHYVIVGTERPTMNAYSLAFLTPPSIATWPATGATTRAWAYAERDVHWALRGFPPNGGDWNIILPDPQNIEANPDFLNYVLKRCRRTDTPWRPLQSDAGRPFGL